MRVLEVDLLGGLLHLGDDGLVDDQLYALFVLVEYDLHVLAVLRVVLAEGGKHGLLDLFVHVLAGNALFLFNVLHRGEEFCVHL